MIVFQALATSLTCTRQAGRSVVLFLGAHPIKLGLSRYLTAAEIDCQDATSETRALLQATDLEELFNRDSWRQLVTVVEVEPDQDILAVRTRHGGSGRSLGSSGHPGPLRLDIRHREGF